LQPGVFAVTEARRLMLVYEMPAGTPRRLQYKGFEVNETTVDLK
jgi:hypothetical protein